jgi:hypothetical protein
MSQEHDDATARQQAFDADAEVEAWRMRRQIDRELITSIRKIGESEKEISRLNIAVFGFRGDNGLMGNIKTLTDSIESLEQRMSQRTGEIHRKIDSGLGGIYKALIGASLSFVVASVILVLGVIIPNS